MNVAQAVVISLEASGGREPVWLPLQLVKLVSSACFRLSARSGRTSKAPHKVNNPFIDSNLITS